jgi:hypothetical protein
MTPYRYPRTTDSSAFQRGTRTLVVFFCVVVQAASSIAAEGASPAFRLSPAATALERDFPVLARLLTAANPWE